MSDLDWKPVRKVIKGSIDEVPKRPGWNVAWWIGKGVEAVTCVKRGQRRCANPACRKRLPKGELVRVGTQYFCRECGGKKL